MALTQICDRKKKLLVTTLRGEVSGQELMDAYSRIYRQPIFDETFHQLWDFRYIETLHLSKEDFEGIKKLAEKYCPKSGTDLGKMVMIASKQPIIDSLRTILASTEERAREKNLFGSLEDGLAWLGITSLPTYVLN